MAFVECRSCGHRISDQAAACPSCGAPAADSPAAGMVGPRGADLRPLGIGEIVDAAIKVYRDHAVTLLKLVALVVVPVQVVSALLGFAISTEAEGVVIRPDGTPSIDGATIATAVGAGVLIAVLGLIGTQLATGASMKAVSDAYLGREPAWGASLEFALGKLGSLLWIQVLIFGAFLGMGIAVAVLVFVSALAPVLLFVSIPVAFGAVLVGIGLYVAWSLAVPALLLEDLRGTSALGRSYRLVRGRFWPVVGVFALAWIIAFLVQSVVGVVFGLIPGLAVGGGILGGAEGASGGALLSDIVTGSLAQTLVTPFTAAVIAIVYFDLRVRREGFDLDLLAQGVGHSDAPGRPPSAEGSGGPPSTPDAGDAGRPPPPPPDPGWRPDPSGGPWESHGRPPRRRDEE